MTATVEFVLGSFWHFVGVMLILGAVSQCVVRCIRGYPPQYMVDKEDQND